MIQAEIKPGQRDINQLCVLVNKIKKKKGKNSKSNLKSRLMIVLKRKVVVNKTRHYFSLM